MASDKFCLRWNDFESNISVAFRELREDKDFFDVTLACDDEQIQAHKVILSACSPFFRSVLKKNPHSHPLLYLRGVKYSDLLAVLNFMYHGEVNVAQEDLNSFLAVAEDMKVKGLTQNSSSSTKPATPYPAPSARPPKPSPRPADRDLAPPPSKRSRPPNFPPHDDQGGGEVEEVQEVVMPGQVKSEPINQAITPLVEMGYEEESFEDYSHEYGQEGGQSYEAGVLAGGGEGNKGSMDFVPRTPEDLDQFISRVELGYNCDICAAFSHASRSNVRNHVESKHFPNTFVYNCNVCRKQCNSRQALQQHKSKICSKRNKALQFSNLYMPEQP